MRKIINRLENEEKKKEKDEDISVKMRKIGTFLFLKLGSGEIVYFCAFFATLGYPFWCFDVPIGCQIFILYLVCLFEDNL